MLVKIMNDDRYDDADPRKGFLLISNVQSVYCSRSLAGVPSAEVEIDGTMQSYDVGGNVIVLADSGLSVLAVFIANENASRRPRSSSSPDPEPEPRKPSGAAEPIPSEVDKLRSLAEKTYQSARKAERESTTVDEAVALTLRAKALLHNARSPMAVDDLAHSLRATPDAVQHTGREKA